jgi:hydroxylamine dehydrogenase
MLQGRIALLAVLITVIVMVAVVRATRSWTVMSASPAGSPSTLRVALPADKCVTCHQRETPSIVEQWARSTHAARRVTCSECHETTKTAAGAKEHFGTYVSPEITSATCQRCHPEEVKQYNRSRHGLPAWTALVGYDALSPGHKAMFDAIEEVRHDPKGGEVPAGFVGATRNALFHLQGDAVVQLTCIGCHQIGRPNADGSVGNCTACHLRHEYSLEQARKPETCNRCHIGPDHPQWEIYQQSSHGILYHTKGHEWNWKQRPGRLSVQDFPAPTCQICHMSGFGRQATTHDVGDRLSWYLFAEISSRRPGWSENRQRMREVCAQCHSSRFIDEEYRKGDEFTEAVNRVVGEAKEINDALVADGLLSDAPFDSLIKFTAYDLWHFYGRTAKFGAWMQGPDYAQWHGYYPMLRELVHLKEQAARLRASGASADARREAESAQ